MHWLCNNIWWKEIQKKNIAIYIRTLTVGYGHKFTWSLQRIKFLLWVWVTPIIKHFLIKLARWNFSCSFPATFPSFPLRWESNVNWMKNRICVLCISLRENLLIFQIVKLKQKLWHFHYGIIAYGEILLK